MATLLREWQFILVDANTGKSIDDDAGLLLPMTAGAPTSPTIYTDPNGTSVSSPLINPRTFSNGRVRFWTERTVETLDLSAMTATGIGFFLTAVPYSRHRILVDTVNRNHMLTVPFGVSDNSEVDTKMTFPVANLLVTDAFMRVTAIDATETMDVGILSTETGFDIDGFLDLMSLGSLGFVNAYPVVTGGTNIDYHKNDVDIYGVFLSQKIAGADAVATVGGTERRYYRTDGVAKTVSYTGTAGSDTGAGYLYFPYVRLA